MKMQSDWRTLVRPLVLLTVLMFFCVAPRETRASEPTNPELKKKALAGDINSQFALGSNYDFGRGVKQSWKEAAHWYEMAANEGSALAQNSLGSMFLKGEGVRTDYPRAL